MKPFKLEVTTAGLSPDEFLKKVQKEAQEYVNSNSPEFQLKELIEKVPSVVAKHLGKPAIETITDVIDLLAPYTRKYAKKVKAEDGEKRERKQATEEEKSKAIADLKSGKKPAEVAKDAGMSVAWAYALKKSLSGGSKPKAKAKTKPKA